MGTQSYLHLLYRHSSPKWDQLTRMESEPISTGPFTTSDRCNWKTENPPVSEKPQGLIDLLDSILFTHNPTWDDCQRLLQVPFTTVEWERILAEGRKRVPGVDGRPTAQPHVVDEGFPLLRPNWDFE